jgi:hypothetical protein
MIGNSLIAAAAVAATMTFALPAQEARADIDVDIGIGFGGYVPGYYGGSYGHDYGYDHGYGYDDGYSYDYPVHKPYRISCAQGRRIVDRSGFRRVNPVDCQLPGYGYTAHRNGHKFMVRVNGRGHITGVSRVY